MLVPLLKEYLIYNKAVDLARFLIDDPCLDLLTVVHFQKVLLYLLNYKVFGLQDSFVNCIEEFYEHKDVARAVEKAI